MNPEETTQQPEVQTPEVATPAPKPAKRPAGRPPKQTAPAKAAPKAQKAPAPETQEPQKQGLPRHPMSGKFVKRKTAEELAADMDFDEEFGDDIGPDATPRSSDNAGEGSVAPEGQVPEDGYTQDLLARAESVGISEEDARAFGSPEKLARVLAMVGAPQKRTAPAAQPPEEDAVPPPPAKGQAGEEEPPFVLDLNPDELTSEALVTNMKKMQEHYEKRVKALESRHQEQEKWVKEYREKAETEQMTRFVGQVDEYIGGLGPEFEAIYGKGGSLTLNPQSPAFKSRDKFIGMLMAEKEIYRKAGLNPPDFKTLADNSIQRLHKDVLERQQNRNLSSRLTQRAAQFTTLPTSREAQNQLTPEQRAERAVAGLLKKMGITVPPSYMTPGPVDEL